MCALIGLLDWVLDRSCVERNRCHRRRVATPEGLAGARLVRRWGGEPSQRP